MRKAKTMILAGAALAALAAPLAAGGFYLHIGSPKDSPEARKMNAALTVQASGCVNPGDVSLTAEAVGLVGGQRRSIPLKTVALGTPGMFGIERQWPKEGTWVIRLTAHDGRLVTGALVPAGPDGVDGLNAKSVREPADADVEAMLRR